MGLRSRFECFYARLNLNVKRLFSILVDGVMLCCDLMADLFLNFSDQLHPSQSFSTNMDHCPLFVLSRPPKCHVALEFRIRVVIRGASSVSYCCRKVISHFASSLRRSAAAKHYVQGEKADLFKMTWETCCSAGLYASFGLFLLDHIALVTA